MALKNVHRHSKCYLLTADCREADNVNIKIDNGDVFSLDRCVCVTRDDFDDLIKKLKNDTYTEPGSIDIVTNYKIVKHQEAEAS